MNEKHPIDDRFRRALHDLEVTPPAAVWEGIVRERSKRRGGYQGWSLGLLLLAGGLSLLLASRTPERNTGTVAQASNATVMEAAVAGPVGTTSADAGSLAMEVVGPDGTNPTRPEMGSHTLDTPSGASVPKEAISPSAPAGPGSTTRRNDRGDAATASNKNALTGPGSKSPSPAIPAAVIVTTGATRSLALNGFPDKLSLRTAELLLVPVVRDSLHGGPERLAYVLPKADWWLAFEVGRYRVERTWYGAGTELVNGLNATELPHDTWSVGVLGGRSWRSGFGVSIGAAYEASEYTYAHLDSRTEIDSLQIMPYMVTLDTMVFVSEVDTTVYGTTEQQQVAGANSLTVVHVPLEAYWHGQQRRWSYGLRLGLAGEFITTRSGYTLDTSSEGDLYSEDAGQQDYDTRYSTTLTGMVGVNLGFAMTEHISLWATPTYMHGLATWDNDDGPWMLPERFGLRVRLSYTFTRIP